MPCYLRLMGKGDIAQVTAIDREAFPIQWPPTNYQRELENKLAHYIVAGDTEVTVEEAGAEVAPEKGLSGIVSKVRRLFSYGHLLGKEALSSSREYIIGFVGIWVMADEAHLINIAVRKSHRRQGIGEMLLISIIDLALELNTEMVTLEVRASNTAAQRLYRKYGFVQVGLRRGYYVSEREDGALMSTESIKSDSFQAKFQQLKQAYTQRRGTVLQPVRR